MSPPTEAQLAQLASRRQQLPSRQQQPHHELQLPSRGHDDFLARLGHAEGRDSARSGGTIRSQRSHVRHAGPLSSEDWAELLDWRASQQKDASQRAAIQAAATPAVSSHPRYMTEQQRQQLAVQEAHQQAIAAQKRKEDEDAVKQGLMSSSGAFAAMQHAGQHSAPALALRHSNAMLPSAEQKRQLALQHSMRVVQAQATAHAQVTRAPNASVAQAQAVKLAHHEEKWRDPRGRAFRVAA